MKPLVFAPSMTSRSSVEPSQKIHQTQRLITFVILAVLMIASQAYAGVAKAPQAERSREIVKLIPAGLNSNCRDLGIEAQETNGKWLCLSLDFVGKSEQISNLEILQTSLDVAQKNDPASTYFYQMKGSLFHGFHVKSVKLVKSSLKK